MDRQNAFNSHQLKQIELVNFLYDRFEFGMLITFTVGLAATLLAAFELSIQGHALWAYLWLLGLALIQLGRWLTKRRYERARLQEHLNHKRWERQFALGVYAAALWQGMGAVLVMPLVSINLQIIFLAFLLGMGAGAIAYLATSMKIFVSYLAFMIFPMAVYLFWQATPDSVVLGCMLLFMIVAYYFGVRRMNRMITEAVHLRFDNELLVNDLQRLLSVVARSNKELDHMSTTDELTGAHNFRAFRVRLEEQRRKHIESHLPLSVVLINVDFYYEYNVEYGQAQGDETLKEIAAILMEELKRKDEVVARVSGAEFGVLLPNVSCENARERTQTVMNVIQQKRIEHRNSSISDFLTISAGISCAPVNPRMNDRDLLTRAEEALRLAKNNGRNRIEIINF